MFPRPVGRRACASARAYRPRCEVAEPRVMLSTFTVTSASDPVLSPGQPPVAGTLRAAIQDANQSGAPSVIAFDIPGSGPQVIHLTSELPPLNFATTVDGYTQPGSVPNTSATGDNASPMIVLDGSSITQIQHSLGLQLKANHSAVQGLVIQNFGGIGVVLSGNNDVVSGDFIGTDPTGKVAQPNGLGIGVIGAGDVIGGTSLSARDIISGNGVGIGIASLAVGGPALLAPEAGSVVQNDLIGVDATGSGALGNSLIGVALAGSGNVVGGTGPGQANVIADNGTAGSTLNMGAGVVVTALSASSQSPVSVQSTGNLISGNSIYGNHDLGIGLLNIPTSTLIPLLATSSTSNIPSVVVNFLSQVHLGVQPNTLPAATTGPNNLQNYPTIGSAIDSGGTTTIRGTLDSRPDAAYQIQFFSNLHASASGYGEGRTYLGSTTVTTDASGAATIAFTTSAVAPGQVISATAIDGSNNTSEFSNAVAVTIPSTTPLSMNPYVTSVTPEFVGRRSEIVLTFATALDPARAANVANYSLDRIGRRGHRLISRPLPIAAIAYDAATESISVRPYRKLRPRFHYLLTINGSGITNTSGDPLLGSTGQPGTSFIATFAGPARHRRR